MNPKSITHLLTILLALNFCGQIVYHSASVQIVQEIDFDQDSEKEESNKEKESDKLSQRPKSSGLESYLASILQGRHSQNLWIAPSLEISDPPPELT